VDPGDSFGSQQQRHTAAGRFVGPRTVENGVAIPGNLSVTLFDLCHGYTKRTRNHLRNAAITMGWRKSMIELFSLAVSSSMSSFGVMRAIPAAKKAAQGKSPRIDLLIEALKRHAETVDMFQNVKR
jgi:hypothetical protein